MIYLIIPVFKNLSHTIEFIASCERFIREDKTYLIVDDSPEYEHFSHFKNTENVEVLKGTGNLWWGGSINLGLAWLEKHIAANRSDDIIIFANNDVQIRETTWPIISRFLSNEKNALFHPRVFNSKGKEIKSGASLKTWVPLRVNYILSPTKALEKANLITGRFLCMHWSVLQKIGGISTNLPHYGGDWDFSLRASRKSYKVYMVRDAICHVDEGITGTRYEAGISLKAFYRALFTDIKSPQNLFYKWRFFRNHNSLPLTAIAIIAEFLKTVIKHIIYSLGKKSL